MSRDSWMNRRDGWLLELASSGRPGTPDRAYAVPVETKFIELALNIIDPDGAWDPEETLEFATRRRPISASIRSLTGRSRAPSRSSRSSFTIGHWVKHMAMTKVDRVGQRCDRALRLPTSR